VQCLLQVFLSFFLEDIRKVQFFTVRMFWVRVAVLSPAMAPDVEARAGYLMSIKVRIVIIN